MGVDAREKSRDPGAAAEGMEKPRNSSTGVESFHPPRMPLLAFVDNDDTSFRGESDDTAPPITANRTKRRRGATRNYVTARTSVIPAPADLAARGWTAIAVTRESDENKADKYYICPAGQKFRSLKAARAQDARDRTDAAEIAAAKAAPRTAPGDSNERGHAK